MLNFNALQAFMDRGGPVLFLIMIAALAMWVLLIERMLYFRFAHNHIVQDTLDKWDSRSDHKSLYAHWIRAKLVSEIRQQAQHNTAMIKAIVAIAPLLGLLGTVTGMVSVFDIMAITSSADAKAMSAGVSRATIPTMAGMVVSLSGLLFTQGLDRRVRRSVQAIEDQMELR